MSREELRKYLPDSPKELSFFGTAIVSLSAALSAVFISAGHPGWTYITIGLGWLGSTIEKYFQLHEPKGKGEKSETQNP
jgi:hypothetical protein